MRTSFKQLICGLAALIGWGCAASSATGEEAHGAFSGNPLVELLPDGRSIKLREPFSYSDAGGRVWGVPEGYVANGASIPRVMWTPIGGPLDGAYRDSSIVHDFYCEHYKTYWPEEHKRDWKEVHRTFFEGLLARGVGLRKAQLMYAAVYYCGPRWEWQGQLVRRIDTWCATGGDRNAEDELYEFIMSGERTLKDIEAFGEAQKVRGMFATTPLEFEKGVIQ